MNTKKGYASGFTLMELMIAMAIAAIVMAAIYKVYLSQQKAYLTQQMVTEMQQNARSAMTLMQREIRMAGYKPAASDGIDNDGDGLIDEDDGDENGHKCGEGIGIVEALRDRITFRMDILSDVPDRCSDGVDNGGLASVVDDPAECYDGLADDPGEEITYTLQANAAGDGKDLVRITLDASGNAVSNILAYDIEALAFGYAVDCNTDGLLDTESGNVIWGYDSGTNPIPMININVETGTSSLMEPVIGPPSTCYPFIGAVKIWLLARTPQPIRGESDTNTYRVGDQTISPASNPGTYDPGYRRTLQSATIYCRNARF
jgi:prepilin-type N-terminal cleavage/methylation domain-containing protein